MPEITRREALAATGVALAAASLGAAEGGRVVQKGRLKQSVCRWCYQKIPLPEFCKAVADLVPANGFPLMQDNMLCNDKRCWCAFSADEDIVAWLRNTVGCAPERRTNVAGRAIGGSEARRVPSGPRR